MNLTDIFTNDSQKPVPNQTQFVGLAAMTDRGILSMCAVLSAIRATLGWDLIPASCPKQHGYTRPHAQSTRTEQNNFSLTCSRCFASRSSMRISSLVTPKTTKLCTSNDLTRTSRFDHSAGSACGRRPKFAEAHELGLVSDCHDIH